MVRRCELNVGEHQRFNESCEDYMTWYDTTTQTLQDLHNSTGTKEEVENRSSKLKVWVLNW